ncbi:MAG: dephospho-CoA kinase [Actinobacteria bacterium]|nr:dephospho-CoA kinase [Actinomycetota bacterium]
MAEQDRRRRAGRERERHRPVVAIGLTGGIGAGKSTALAMFRELGALTASADHIVHRLYEQQGLITAVAEHFGPVVLNGQGRIDRQKVAQLVKGRPDQLRWLEQVTHPIVASEIEHLIGGASPGSVIVCEVPLLFETRFERLFELVVTVEAAPKQRRSRSAGRFDPVVFAEFEDLQASSEQRIAWSDFVYHNDGSLDDMRAFVRDTYERAKGLLGGACD